MATNTLIKIDNLTKTFSIPSEKRDTIKSTLLNVFSPVRKIEFKALDDINLEINQGEFIGFIGSNGSGKSTLLKIIAGIYEPNQGKVQVNGIVVPFLELGVGFNPDLSARENIFLNGTILGMSRKHLEERYYQILEFAELQKFAEVPIKNLSSGMQVRLAFSIAIQSDADIYILDEVLAVGDQAFQEKSLAEIKNLKAAGKTILYVSHNLDSIQSHCDKAVLLNKGKVVKVGTPEETVEAYENLVMQNQNINAEEKVQEKEEEQKGKITGISILDENQKPTSTVNHGKPFFVEVNFTTSRVDEDSYNVGIGIYSAASEYIYGLNTKTDKILVDKSAKKVLLKFDKNPFLNGKYFLNVVLFTEDEENPVDFQGRARYFKVSNAPQYRGNIQLDHTWITTEHSKEK